jgi:hypothetical protein
MGIPIIDPGGSQALWRGILRVFAIPGNKDRARFWKIAVRQFEGMPRYGFSATFARFLSVLCG